MHANVQVIAPIVTSSHEWMKLLLFKFYAEWQESIRESKEFVVVTLADSDTIPSQLFVLPEQGGLPLRITETLNNNHTQKLCQSDLNEMLGHSGTLVDNPYCYDIAVIYERSELSLQLSFRGKEMGKVLIPVESLEHPENRKHVLGEVRKKIHQEVMPLSIYALIPQGNA